MQARSKSGRAEAARWLGALDMLRLVHASPGITRADASRRLGITSGSATEICARLRDLELLSERPAPPSGRGRPTTTLHAHRHGPLTAVVDVRHADWRAGVADLEGRLTDLATGRHRDRRPGAVIADLRGAIGALAERHGPRLRSVSISVTGTVQNNRVAQASGLGWQDVEIEPLAPGVPQRVCNDATLAGLAVARRSHPDRSVLYLHIEVGIGGVLVDRGHALSGATGAGGEFGHLPLGDPAVPCPCGAMGCWDVAVDGRAMARLRGEPAPDDPRTYATETMSDGAPAARTAVGECAAFLGRGVAGLVNALDPEIVAFGGLAPDLQQAAGEELDRAYAAGLMRFRRTAPPPLLPTEFGADGPLRGAAESGFDEILTEGALARWADERRG
ncbi:ROK family transcriptional regulator [Glycomyces xiaoerkulensis]|uniref:ROK family transcriptional regulator n=1 Tax=Glycomyces xiaoerkulensis TaxID=2038139 RepID=UPI000C26A768|nr:ROK family transcriptional regulator [Glycomyces xiaoerkulensis]